MNSIQEVASDPVTSTSIGRARQAAAHERAALMRATGLVITEQGQIARPDPVATGLRIANAIAAAVYGPRGEVR